MKLKAIIGCISAVAILTVASPVLALSLGVSPTHVELEVPGGGSATTDVNIHYFTGDVEISLVDIPLRVEPSIIHVDASDEPVVIELTVYGNHSLDTQVYDGYIRFIAVSGGAATGGVQVIAKITNTADGIVPLLPSVPAAQEPTVKEPAPEASSPPSPPPASAPTPTSPTSPTSPTPPPSPPAPIAQQEGELPLIPIAAGSISVLVILFLIFLLTRRLRY